MNEPLIFDIALGRTKPVNMRDDSVRCPFCDRSKLTDILAQDGHIIWLMNKYPVLQNTWPTVIVETEGDQGELSTLSVDDATRIIQFGLDRWHETISTKEIVAVHLQNTEALRRCVARHLKLAGVQLLQLCIQPLL